MLVASTQYKGKMRVLVASIQYKCKIRVLVASIQYKGKIRVLVASNQYKDKCDCYIYLPLKTPFLVILYLIRTSKKNRQHTGQRKKYVI